MTLPGSLLAKVTSSRRASSSAADTEAASLSDPSVCFSACSGLTNTKCKSDISALRSTILRFLETSQCFYPKKAGSAPDLVPLTDDWPIQHWKDIPSEVFSTFWKRATKEKPLSLSYSGISALETCPLKWTYSYILKFSPERVDELAVRGTRFHEIAEHAYDEVTVVDGKIKLSVPDGLNPDMLGMTNWLQRYEQKRWEAEAKPDDPKVIIPFKREWDIMAPAMEVDGVWVALHGIIDRVEKHGDALMLWDYKTGRYSKSGVSKHLRQLYFYKQLMEQCGEKVWGIGVIYPAEGKTETRIGSELNKRSMSSISKRIAKAVATLKCLENAEPRWNSFGFCKYCEYRRPFCSEFEQW